ncbi:hypothetical protein Tco_1180059 [Tanacetum coccineum]
MFIISFIIGGAPAMARDMIIRNPVVELLTTDELTRLAGYGEEKLSTVVVAGTLLCDAFYVKILPLSHIQSLEHWWEFRVVILVLTGKQVNHQTG